MTLDQLVVEALAAKDRFWFIQELQVKDYTDSTVTLHFIIGPGLFVQVFYSQRGGRLSFALVGASGRLYGRDREHSLWHLHPFGQQYVAIHNGQVIDHDPDLRTPHLRIFNRLGHTPVLLKQVTTEPERELVFRSPRLERSRSFGT